MSATTLLSLDIPFAVPFVHRLRFTRDVFGADQEVLASLLETSDGQPARVQFWVDGDVLQSLPQLRQKILAFVQQHSARLQFAGPVLHVVPGGEAVKNDVHLLEQMLRQFDEADLDRRSYVVVIGGGAVLDAVGFAAAICHRGLRLVRLPTTTLSQADSGVGVKNAVNLFGKKNWIGSFAVPWAVINDASLLATLPDRDFICGFAEAVKVSLLKDPALFQQICRDAGRIRQRDLEAAGPVIVASARLHLAHITAGGDPFEAREARPLDFGHWLAHKLEVLSEFTVRHGEAVALGVAVDTVYSSLRHGLDENDALAVLHCLRDLGFDLHHDRLAEADSLFRGLEEFRQHLGGRLTLTLLQGIGRPIDVHEVDHTAMREALASVSSFGMRFRSEVLREPGPGVPMHHERTDPCNVRSGLSPLAAIAPEKPHPARSGPRPDR
jgi:3-dehydroquinate synthase